VADFVHLHVHSEYSLLDGLPHPHELAERAQDHRQPAIALTDHGTMFAAIEFHDACKQVGVKPLIGLEAYLAARRMQESRLAAARKAAGGSSDSSGGGGGQRC